MGIISLVLLVLTLITLSLAGDYNYGKVVEKSLLFYEAQRTGTLSANNRISWMFLENSTSDIPSLFPEI